MLYITYIDLNNSDPSDTGHSGIKKKVDGQIQAFKKYFDRVYYSCRCGQMFYLMDGARVVAKELAITRKDCNKALCTWLDKYGIQRTYIRYPFSDPWFLEFLRIQKQKEIRSVLELPTYPYDSEVTNVRIKAEDAYYRTQLRQYVELISTYSKHEEIWGVPCVSLVNGIVIENLPLCTKVKERKKIVLIGVASLVMWHGYERIIEGLYKYYQKGGDYDFLFKVVGKGEESNRYKMLVENYGIQSHVEFCGRLEGEKLDRQYEMSDIAVGSLGFYKTGLKDATPIKAADYCGRGIPFIVGYNDLRFSGKEPFIMHVPSDSSAVDMNQVVDFYEKITTQSGYHEKIRDYALNHLTWESIMKPVVEYLQ